MFKSVSHKLIMTALVVASFHAVTAEAQRGPRRGPPGQTAPVYPPPYQGGPGYANTEVVQIYVGRPVGNETFALRRLARIDQNYAGYEVVSVSAGTQSNNPYRTDVQLIADGYVVATQTNPGRQINLYPQRPLILDQTVRRLELSIIGSTYMDVIYITLRRPHTPGRPPHQQPPYQQPQPPYQQPQPPYQPQPPVRPQPPAQPPQQPIPGGTWIEGGQTISMGQTLSSSNGQVTLSMQSDCNLVMYSNGRSTWSTNTAGHQNCMAAFQTDGNFVVYSNGAPIWSSRTNAYGGARMLLQNDGNLVIYSGSTPVWQTNTRR